MRLGKFVVGTIIGIAAGALLAPKKGSELREDIKNKSQETYDKVKGLSKEDVEALFNDSIDKVKKNIDEFDINEFKDSTKVKLDELQGKLEELAIKVKETEQYDKVVAGVEDIKGKVNEALDSIRNNASDDEIEAEINEVEEELDEMLEDIED